MSLELAGSVRRGVKRTYSAACPQGTLVEEPVAPAARLLSESDSDLEARAQSLFGANTSEEVSESDPELTGAVKRTNSFDHVTSPPAKRRLVPDDGLTLLIKYVYQKYFTRQTPQITMGPIRLDFEVAPRFEGPIVIPGLAHFFAAKFGAVDLGALEAVAHPGAVGAIVPAAPAAAVAFVADPLLPPVFPPIRKSDGRLTQIGQLYEMHNKFYLSRGLTVETLAAILIAYERRIVIQLNDTGKFSVLGLFTINFSKEIYNQLSKTGHYATKTKKIVVPVFND